MAADGADLILTGGGNTIDPLDAALVALPRIGAEMVKFGAPAHPGSMFWLAYRGQTPIFNLASCSMYSKATVADLVLPWIMAGERVTADDLAALGYGGLLDRDMGFRFPATRQRKRTTRATSNRTQVITPTTAPSPGRARRNGATILGPDLDS